METWKRLDQRFGDKGWWQFVKFNLVSLSITLVQLLLANVLPLFFDGMTAKLPGFLRGIFNSDALFSEPGPYVRDGVVTWGFVLPFFLSNFLANIYGYFMNMRTTFRGKGTRLGLTAYLVVLTSLILFTTWLQGLIVARLGEGGWKELSRTIAALSAGLVQMAVLFPLEKFVLFRKRERIDERPE